MTKIVILKTKKIYLDHVVSMKIHATDGLPRDVNRGDIVLIAQTKETLEPHQQQIAYAAIYDFAREDNDGMTDAIFGRHWRYIIFLQDLAALLTPFFMDEVQISDENYGRGAQTIKYVEHDDTEAIVEGGYLMPLVSTNGDRYLGRRSILAPRLLKIGANDNREHK